MQSHNWDGKKMWKIIVWGVLLLLYLLIGIFQVVKGHFSISGFVIYLAGFIGLSSTLCKSLASNSLKLFLLWNRLKNRLRNYPSMWTIFARYDGEYNSAIISKFKDFILDGENIRYHKKIHHQTVQSMHFSINGSLTFFLELESKKIGEHQNDFISMKLSTFEIGCNDAERKLNTQIVPLLEKFQNYFRPQDVFYTVSINFLGRNPFYTVYIEHLRPDKIDDFRVNLKTHAYKPNQRADKVIIRKEKLVLETTSLQCLKELAKDFIFLSPNLTKVMQA